MELLRKGKRQYAGYTQGGRRGVALLCLCLLSLPAQAIWLGQSQVNPYLEVQEIYESNLYNASTDEESGLITVISPGVHAEFPNSEDAKVRVIGNYRANLKLYNKHGDSSVDPNEELNTIEHRLEGKMEAKLSSGFAFATGYVLDLTSFPPSNPVDMNEAELSVNTREHYAQHTFTAMGQYSFVDRYEVQLEYTGMLRSYEENDDSDTTTHDIDATFFYRLFPSLTLLGGGGYGMTDLQGSDSSDSTIYRGFGGARFDATSVLTGQIKLGVIAKDFTENEFEDVTTVYALGEIAAKFSENTKLSVLLNREVSDTSLTSTTTDNGEYYIATGIQGNLTHTLAVLPNLTLRGLAGLKKEVYPEDSDERDDTIFEVGAGADYKFYKFLILGAEYIHIQSDSSVSGYEYSADRAMISVRGIL